MVVVAVGVVRVGFEGGSVSSRLEPVVGGCGRWWAVVGGVGGVGGVGSRGWSSAVWAAQAACVVVPVS